MYRVRAEKVSGKKVFAKGAWLTCIGNKPVSVGDLIYTDGRCVYGFYQESQQPPVITPKVKKILAIPIVLSENTSIWDSQKIYYNFENGILSKVQDDENNCCMVINGYSRKVLFTSADKNILAMNLDRQDNLYKIVYLKDDKEIKIYKNDESLTAISVSDFYETGEDTYCTPFWAFIENENDWAFMISFAGFSYSFLYPPPTQPEYTYISGSSYYFDSSGRREKISAWSGTMKYDVAADWVNPKMSLNKTENFTMAQGIKFPLQDGFYFTAENFLTPSYCCSAPWVSKRNIFSPNGNLIFSGYFMWTSKIVICELSSTRFLIGVSVGVSSDGSFAQALSATGGLDDTSGYPEIVLFSGEFFAEGLYICENGEMQRIDDSIVNAVLNQRLRPMTNYENWIANKEEM